MCSRFPGAVNIHVLNFWPSSARRLFFNSLLAVFICSVDTNAEIKSYCDFYAFNYLLIFFSLYLSGLQKTMLYQTWYVVSQRALYMQSHFCPYNMSDNRSYMDVRVPNRPVYIPSQHPCLSELSPESLLTVEICFYTYICLIQLVIAMMELYMYVTSLVIGSIHKFFSLYKYILAQGNAFFYFYHCFILFIVSLLHGSIIQVC